MKPNKPKVLVVDDDKDMLHLLSIRLSSEGFDIETARDGNEAMDSVMKSRPDVVVTDLKMPGMDGMSLLEALQRKAPTLPVIMITAHGTIPDAVTATKEGAVSFITKPIDKNELLAQLRAATRYAHDGDVSADQQIVTRNPVMHDLMARARRAATAGIPVLLGGESGTGKELLALYIHRSSGRKGAFVPVNCTAIPDALLESELFGHEKGAFTGAEQPREGLIGAADGGTLFLDEIGDMPSGVQAKLLRALQEKKIRPLGARQEQEIDILVVSATHRNLEAMVQEGKFREDLFYRLNVVQLQLPTLRERPEDIPLLVQHFLAAESGERARKVITAEAMEILVAQPWQGNIRQLHNVIQQCVAMSSGSVITEVQVRDALGDDVRELPSFSEARDEFTRQYLIQLLKLTEGNVSQAARLADRNRTDFHKLLKKHNVDSRDFKS